MKLRVLGINDIPELISTVDYITGRVGLLTERGDTSTVVTAQPRCPVFGAGGHEPGGGRAVRYAEIHLHRMNSYRRRQGSDDLHDQRRDAY